MNPLIRLSNRVRGLSVLSLMLVICSVGAHADTISGFFDSLKNKGVLYVGYAVGIVVVVLAAMLGLYGLVWAFNRIKARFGR